MKIHFIRHGQPDYSMVNPEDNIETPNSSPLTTKGQEQASAVNVELIKNAEIMLVSPYKRTLETAKIINKKLNKKLIIEENLHEWIPDKTKTSKAKEFNKFNLMYLKGELNLCNCENDEEMLNRLNSVIEKYKNYNEIIIVAHQRIINTLIQHNLKYCEVYTYIV